MKKIEVGAFYKIPLGLLPIVIVFWQLNVSSGVPGFRISDYFSLFTILSNTFAGIVLLLSAFKFKIEDRRKLDYLRGMNATYLLIVAIVYYALVADSGGFQYLTIDHANFILHRLMPIVLLIDFAIDRPTDRFVYKKTLLWLIPPLAYVSYSLIRGNISKWYPYTFLDPNEVDGYKSVFFYSLGITAGFIFFGYGIYYICNCRRKPLNP